MKKLIALLLVTGLVMPSIVSANTATAYWSRARITRGAALHNLIIWTSSTNLFDATLEGENVFADVPDDDSARTRVISVAFANGIITGEPGGMFRPDDFITNAEVITMAVRILGHGERAIELGGFPYGYLEVSREIGLLQNTYYYHRFSAYENVYRIVDSRNKNAYMSNGTFELLYQSLTNMVYPIIEPIDIFGETIWFPAYHRIIYSGVFFVYEILRMC